MIPKFEQPTIEPTTPTNEAVKITLNAMIEHYNKYIVGKD